MSLNCCVPKCKQRGRKDELGNKVSFHRLPADEELRKKWMLAIRWGARTCPSVTKHSAVCSKHFKKTDFLANVSRGQNLLRYGAVPSIFVFSEPRDSPELPAVQAITSHIVSEIGVRAQKKEAVIIDSDDVPMSEELQQDTIELSGTQICGEPALYVLEPSVPQACGVPQPDAVKLFAPQARGELQRTVMEHCPPKARDAQQPVRESPSLQAHDGAQAHVVECPTSRACDYTKADAVEPRALRVREVLQPSGVVLSESQGCREPKCGEQLEQQRQTVSHLNAEVEMLRKELFNAKQSVYKLEAENTLLKRELREENAKAEVFCVEQVRNSDKTFHAYTGMTSYENFKAFLTFLDPGENGSNVARWEMSPSFATSLARKRSLSVENELFLVLVRLKLGLLEFDIAHRFRISQGTVSRIFTSWINFLHQRLTKLPLWMSREVVDQTMPPTFAEKCPTARVILGIAEIPCEVPKFLAPQTNTSPHNKSANILKGIVGMSPNGLVSFVSDLLPGSTSNMQCVIESGFLGLAFESGDTVITDEGFLIEDLLRDKGVYLNMPLFPKNRKQLSREQNYREEIASLCSYVERRLRRVKAFHIFDRPLPIAMANSVNQIWKVAVILTNLQGTVVQKLDATTDSVTEEDHQVES